MCNEMLRRILPFYLARRRMRCFNSLRTRRDTLNNEEPPRVGMECTALLSKIDLDDVRTKTAAVPLPITPSNYIRMDYLLYNIRILDQG